MKQKPTMLNITGVNAKVVGKEVINALYELTKIVPGGKRIKQFDQDKYLKMTPKDITRTFLVDTFADTVDSSSSNSVKIRKALYNSWDTIVVPDNYFYPQQKRMEVTLGRFIANKFILQGSGAITATGFVNEELGKKGLGKLDGVLGNLYLEDKIDRETINRYTDRRDALGYWLNGMLAHTLSEKMLKPLPKVEKMKAELIKKYKKDLDAGSLDAMTKISDDLIKVAREELKGDPGMDLYDSGELDFNNNYRNNSIIKGAVVNKITGGYDFIGTSFMNGIEIKDLPAHANSILASQYPTSIATEDAGYMGKKLLALLQMMEISEDPNSDCGTLQLIPFKINKNNKEAVLYSYIKEGGQLRLLTKENIDKYVGQTVMMRSPMTCIGDKICGVCAGKLFYLLGIKYAGLFSVQISHARLNLALKAKHNSVVDIYTLNPDDLIQDL